MGDEENPPLIKVSLYFKIIIKNNGDSLIMTIKQLKPKIIWKKRMLLTICIVFGLIIAGVVFWNVSPIPKAFLIKKAFEGGMFVQSNNYKKCSKRDTNC